MEGYAASNNQVAKAGTMAGLAGLHDSFFAYYHSDHVLAGVNAPWAASPNFLYASPIFHNNRHFFAAGALHHAIPEGFLEQSAYRRHLLGLHGAYALPAVGFEWGIGFLGADFFIDAAGNVLNRNLPAIQYVLAHGSPFGEFLVRVAECQYGTNRSEPDLRQLVQKLHHGPVGGGDGAFDPMFALLFEFASGGPDDDDAAPDPDDELWGLFETPRKVPRDRR